MPYENEATPEGVCYVGRHYRITFEPTDILVGGFPLNQLVCYFEEIRECGIENMGLDRTSYATVKINGRNVDQLSTSQQVYCRITDSVFDVQCADIGSEDFGSKITGAVLDILKRVKAQTPPINHGTLCGANPSCPSNPLANTIIDIHCYDTDGPCVIDPPFECNSVWQGVCTVTTPLGDGNTEIGIESPALFPSNWCCYEQNWEPDCDYVDELVKQLNLLQFSTTMSSVFKRLFSMGMDGVISGGLTVNWGNVLGVIDDIADPRVRDAARKIQEAHAKAKLNYIACLINELNEANKC